MVEVLDWLEAGEADKVVFADESELIRYEQFIIISKKIGSSISSVVHCTRQPIVVFVDRNIKSLYCMTGILYSGNFYVPIDSCQPQDRIKSMVEQIQPAAILVASDDTVKVTDLYAGCPVLSYTELISHDVDEDVLQKIREATLDIDPIYAICTSGSTGVPKVVLISHKSVVDFIPKFVGTFGLRKNEIFGNQAPFDFDVSTKDIYSTFFLGASMYIIPKKTFVMPKLLMSCLNEQKITTIIWAVSAMCIPSGFNGFKYEVPQYLRNVLFSGEQMPMKHLNVWRKYLPDIQYVNLYGPTEITCNCTYYIIDREFEDTEALPIGKPFENEAVIVINEKGQSIKAGEMGEICVRGSCLALGYYRDPEKTAQAFRQTPEHNNYQELVYHTGDLAYLNEHNEFVFASRKDFQIKHMGHRIELGEIETFAGNTEGVRRVCCLYDESKNKIVLFFDGNVEEKMIIERLKEKLPKYMLPNKYIHLDNMPLNKNGKTDRNKLKEIMTGCN